MITIYKYLNYFLNFQLQVKKALCLSSNMTPVWGFYHLNWQGYKGFGHQWSRLKQMETIKLHIL